MLQKNKKEVIMNRKKIFYVGDRSGKTRTGVMTVVSVVDSKEKNVELGFSFCSPKDKFS